MLRISSHLLRNLLTLSVLLLAIFGLDAHHSAYANAKTRADITSDAACDLESDRMSRLSRAGQIDLFQPPRLDDRPVPVDIGLYVEQLDSISEIHHSFKVEAFVELIWCDPRLAYADETDAPPRQIFLEDRAHDMLSEIWWPDLTFSNAADKPEIQQEELILFPDGTVIYEERVAVEVRANYDFTQFPFDRQNLVIEIESFAWPSSDMTFRRDEDKIGFAQDFNIPSWTLTGYESEIRNVQEIRDRDTFSELLVTIHAERVSSPFFFRLILPLVLIVIVSWSVFWLRSSDTGRFGVTFTTILTVVAFNFVVTDKLPNVPEITYLETLFGFAFLFLLLVVIENTAIDKLTARGHEATAHRIDRISSIAFPVFFFVGAALVTVAFGIL